MRTAQWLRMRTLRIVSLAAVVLYSQVPACADGGHEESEQQPSDDDSTDHEPTDDLDPGFDDGLGGLLDGDPTVIPAPVDSDSPDPTAKPRCDATAKASDYCAGDHVTDGIKNTLYRCSGPNTDAKAIKVCAAGCVIAPAGTADYCKATAPTCDPTASTGEYCGGDKVSSASPNTLYHCNGPGPATVVKVCAAGCVVAPAGSDDYCKSTSTTGSPSADACPHVSSILRWGLHPIASDRLRCVGITAARITQTIGSAAASAGTHAQDGTYDGHPYSAATDISVSGLTDAQVKTLSAKMDAIGFATFYRKPCYDGWPCSEARHIHAVFAGARMKSSLRAQISDFLAGKNGLASHTTYNFYQPPAEVKAYIKKIFDAAN